MRNYINHTLHASDGPKKAAVLTHENSRISYHFNCGTIGLATRCHFLFKKKENILLYLPRRHKLGCLAAISSAQTCAQQPNTRINVYLSADQIFLDRITKNHLIPTLSRFEQFTPIITAEVTDKTRSLFIER